MVFEAIFSGMILCSAPSWRTGIKSRMGTERSALPLLAQRGFIQRYNSFFLFRALNFYRKWRRVGHHGPNACLKPEVCENNSDMAWPSRIDWKWRKFSELRFWGHLKVRTVAFRLKPWRCCIQDQLEAVHYTKSHYCTQQTDQSTPGIPLSSNLEMIKWATLGEGLFRIVSHRLDQ